MLTIQDIRKAATRLSGIAVHTPLLPFRDGAFIKPESLQPTGSFKIRGAYNALSQLSAEERARGVVAHSSGNHGQAIARAARLLGMRAIVVMPNNAPAVKVAGVRADGALIEFVGPHNVERVERAHQIAHDDGLILVPSANHEDVICGQATIGLEIVEELRARGITDPPVVIVPVGLGGLAAGVGLAVMSLSEDASVFGAEPALAADTHESIDRGERVAWPAEQTARTIADGLRGESPAEIAFALLKQHLTDVITVSEDEIVEAMRVGAREARLVLEPSGATSLAAYLSRVGELPAGPVVIVVSGGNVDQNLYASWLAAG
ncbi:MAG TPA: threonine/serine dehydratase [Candidatus Limnocylindrales bacterium]|nr:threonine/serine dehydratase [Candidatus Limnocylindrales bacterium]